MKDILALVEENTHIAGRLYLLKVLAPEIAKDIKAFHGKRKDRPQREYKVKGGYGKKDFYYPHY